MDEHDLLNHLAVQARKERVPEINVADRVARTLANRKQKADRSLFFFASGWALAATVMAVLSWEAWFAFYDPFVLTLGSIATGL